MDERWKELWERIEDVRPTMRPSRDGTLRGGRWWTQGDAISADDDPRIP
jgi:hypothetical protein